MPSRAFLNALGEGKGWGSSPRRANRLLAGKKIADWLASFLQPSDALDLLENHGSRWREGGSQFEEEEKKHSCWSPDSWDDPQLWRGLCATDPSFWVCWMTAGRTPRLPKHFPHPTPPRPQTLPCPPRRCWARGNGRGVKKAGVSCGHGPSELRWEGSGLRGRVRLRDAVFMIGWRPFPHRSLKAGVKGGFWFRRLMAPCCWAGLGWRGGALCLTSRMAVVGGGSEGPVLRSANPSASPVGGAEKVGGCLRWRNYEKMRWFGGLYYNNGAESRVYK